MTLGVLAATLVASKLSETRRPDALARRLDSIPMLVDGWQGTTVAGPSERVQAKLLLTESLSRVYRRGDRAIELWIAYYAEQRAGESMHSPRACLPGAGWEPVEFGSAEVPGLDGTPVRVNRYLVEQSGVKIQVLYWYQSKVRIVASEYSGKAFLIWDSIRGRGTGGSLVRITAPAGPNAVDDEVTFASRVIPAMKSCLTP